MLARRHADPAGCLAHHRIDAFQTDNRVSQDGQDGIEHQRQKGRCIADRSAQQRHHQGQKGQAGYGLDNAGQIQDQASQARPRCRVDAKRQADGQPDQDGRQRQDHMAGKQVRQFGPAFGEIGIHRPSSAIART